MTRLLTRLADIAYRRRGRMVLAWIAATVVIIGVGSSLAGEYNADYNTPGSESKAASDLTEQRFSGYSGQEVYVVWKDPDGARSPAARERIDAFLAEAKKVDHIAEQTPIRVSRDGTIGATTLPLTVAGWDVAEGGRREADRRRREEQRRRAARSSSAAIRSTPRRSRPAPRGSASSAPRSCC